MHEKVKKRSQKRFGANASVSYLDGDGERGGAEVPLHKVGHPLSGAEQIRQLVRPKVAKALHRSQRTHQHV